MKKTLKLLVLAGALLSVGALAQQATQNWYFNFPAYYYVYTNTTSVTFDFSKSQSEVDTVEYTGNDGQASSDALLSCIDSFVSASLPVTANDTSAGTSSLGTCEFGPTSVVTNSSSYSVDWNNLGGADGSLLVVTNAASYKVSVYIDDAVGDGLPTGVTYKVAAEFGDATSISFTTIPEGSASASQIVPDPNSGDSNYFYTQYRNVYVVPLTFAADVDPTLAATTTTLTTVVTYTASAP